MKSPPEIKKELGSEASIPMLIKNGKGFNAEFYVSVDNNIIDVCGNVTVGIYRLFQCIFVLHKQYTPEVLHFYRLLERFVNVRTISPAPAVERILDKISNTIIE